MVVNFQPNVTEHALCNITAIWSARNDVFLVHIGFYKLLSVTWETCGWIPSYIELRMEDPMKPWLQFSLARAFHKKYAGRLVSIAK